MGLNNEIVREHMSSLFGVNQLSNVSHQLSLASNSIEKKKVIIENFCLALKDNGADYVLPFSFKNNSGTKTTHYLVFITKNFLGFDKMKYIMRQESSTSGDGASSLGYNPNYKPGTLLYSSKFPLNILIDSLKEFEGQKIPFKDLYKNHSPNNPYLKKEYKEPLLLLSNNGKLIIKPNSFKRLRKNTVPDDSSIIFGNKL
jgi:hypothetical protein